MTKSGYIKKVLGIPGYPFDDLYINPNYRFKNIGTVLALRNFLDTAYANLAVQNLYLGTERALDVSGTGMRLGDTTLSPRLPSMTTVEKNALTPVVGDMVYDTDLQKGQIYEGFAPGWVNLV